MLRIDLLCNQYLSARAEGNNLLVLYPQAYSTNCWDWTGQITPNRNDDYDTRNSLQQNTVNRMADSLRGEINRILDQMFVGGNVGAHTRDTKTDRETS